MNRSIVSIYCVVEMKLYPTLTVLHVALLSILMLFPAMKPYEFSGLTVLRLQRPLLFLNIREYFPALCIWLLDHFPEHVKRLPGAFPAISQLQIHRQISSLPTVHAWNDKWHYRLSRY